MFVNVCDDAWICVDGCHHMNDDVCGSENENENENENDCGILFVFLCHHVRLDVVAVLLVAWGHWHRR